MQNEAYSPTLGSTPAMMENAIASGISASATTAPAKMSFWTLENHSRLKIVVFKLPLSSTYPRKAKTLNVLEIPHLP